MRVTPEQVEEAMRSFNRGSGGGPTGLRPQHLKDAMVPGWRDELVRQTTQLINLMLSGAACAEVQPWLCGASLTALPKPSGDLRPVAVGEYWRRLTSKIAAKSATSDLRPYFEPVQLGVASKVGCETIVHVARQWLYRNQADPNRVLVAIDLANAFNTVDRSAFLAEARRLCHDLVPWLDFCYKGPSKLLLGSGALSSARGIQQGDPLGPLLFSAAIHDAILQAQAETEQQFPGELDWVAFYLDDGTAAGTARAVKKFVDRLLAQLADRGLRANLDKCEVVPPAGAAGTRACEVFAGWHHVTAGTFKLLGAPLGPAEFCASKIAARVAKARTLLSKIGEYADPQGGMHVLRHCASWSKLVYACRTIPPAHIAEELRAFDEALRESASAVVGKPLPDHSWQIAQLSLAQGGLGLRLPTLHSAAAYLGSVRASADLCSQVDKKFDPSDAAGGLGLLNALHRVQAACLPAAPVQSIAVSDLSLIGSQRILSSQIDAKIADTLSRDFQTPGAIPRHLALAAVPGAGAWLTAPASRDTREIDEPLYRICAQRRLRVPIFNGDEICPLCGAPMDRFGDHALVCPCGGDRVIRHNSIRDQLFDEMRGGGLSVEREKTGLLPGRPAEDGLPSTAQARRPADIWVASRDAKPPQALDFAVTAGLRDPAIGADEAMVAAVFQDYEHHKRNHLDTDSQCRRQGLAFVPFIIEAHAGGLSPLARRTLDTVAKAVAATTHSEPAAVALRIAQRISCSLQRETARAVLRRQGGPVCSAASPTGWDAVAPDSLAWQ